MIKAKRLLWQLFPSYLLLTVLPLAAAILFATAATKQFYLNQTRVGLQAQARLIADTIRRLPVPLDAPTVNAGIHGLGVEPGVRITVVLPSGAVIGDSRQDYRKMENRGDREEIRKALQGIPGTAIRDSNTLNQRMMFVAVPVMDGGSVVAVVRTAIAVSAIDAELSGMRWRIVAVGLIIALLAVILSLMVSRRIARPIDEIRQGARRFAAGDFGRSIPVSNSEEFGALAVTMNHMAREIEERIHKTVSQRNEIEAILSSMIEGVIAADMDDRVIRMNHAAEAIVNVSAGAGIGRHLHELIRNTVFQDILTRARTGKQMAEGDIVLYKGDERILHMHCAPLCDSQNVQIGILVVLNDVTPLRRLENVRRDFVANVSHEIRTPLTAIKGFVETLRLHRVDDPAEAERFLEIIEKHVNRLAAIIEDLLKLSRLEQEKGSMDLHLKAVPLADVLKPALQACQPRAEARGITVLAAADAAVRVMADAPLLEQAVVNLLDNAIKYSPPGSSVQLSARKAGGETVVEVSDNGPGISKKHLPRLFERFYRVDAARSRQMGGTGLGLAIVKHIVQVHGGHVSVESTPGKGSSFRIHLPLPPVAETPDSARAPGADATR